MGTASEWLEVALSGAFWGGFMLLCDIFGESSSRDKLSLSRRILVWSLAGLMVGLWSTFHWRGFRWPLVIFHVLALVGIWLAVKLQRSKPGEQAGSSAALSK